MSTSNTRRTLVISALAGLAITTTTEAFAPAISSLAKTHHQPDRAGWTVPFAVEEPTSEAVFKAPEEDEQEDAPKKEDQIALDTVEKLGRGAAKAKRGKRKGGSSAPTPAKKAASALAPEEVYYEGPPAITETIAPTVSILTVVGIIPAAAAWARQAWVRYKITTRRIRVTSGIGGKEMAEIVYPDIVEIRTAKRLFGDGDMVAFLRDGAKFEMRNIPDFEEAMEFILKQVDPEVAKQYREKGDVTNPPQN